MCQLNVVVERGDSRKTIMESVTGLEVTADGITLTTFFEAPLVVRGVHVKSIDFLGGSVLLAADGEQIAAQEA